MSDERLTPLRPAPDGRSQQIERLCNLLLDQTSATNKKTAVEERLARGLEKVSTTIYDAETRRETLDRANDIRWKEVAARLDTMGAAITLIANRQLTLPPGSDNGRNPIKILAKLDEMSPRGQRLVVWLVGIIVAGAVAAIAFHFKGL